MSSFYAPTNLSPNNIALDADTDNIFSWSNQYQVSYQVVILDNEDSAVVFDSGVIESTQTEITVPAGTFSNNRIYQWKVTSQTKAGSRDSLYAPFYATIKPSIEFAPPSMITSPSYEFKAKYDHADEIPMLSYRYILSTNGSVVYDTGMVFDWNLTCYATDLSPNQTYSIQVQATAQNGLTTSSPNHSFEVSYDVPQSIVKPKIEPLPDLASILIDWADLKQLVGVVDGEYSYVTGVTNNAIALTPGSSITFYDDIPEDFTAVITLKLPYGFSGKLIALKNSKTGEEFTVGYDGERFWYQRAYRFVRGKLTQFYNIWFKIVIRKYSIAIIQGAYFEEIK